MNDVNELWSSPWRKLQKNLASGFDMAGSGPGFRISEPPVPGPTASSASWLVRARHRRVRVSFRALPL
jgi:hypothetical protein